MFSRLWCHKLDENRCQAEHRKACPTQPESAPSNPGALVFVVKGHPTSAAPAPRLPGVSKEKADQKPAHSAGSWGLHYGLASCSSLGPQGHSEQAGGQTLSQNPLSTHDLDSLNPSSYLNLLPFFNGMKATNMRNLRAFVPDVKCFLQQFPASFWELCCHQGSWLMPLIKWGRNSQQSTCTAKGH